jgi:alpha-N-arabinofuranosidase
MKRLRTTLSLLTVMAATGTFAQTAHFSYFSYQGHDARFERPINAKNQYFNPVVSGYYPDPSVLRVGDTYWLVNSTFGYFPGVPLFKSHDLVSWKQVGSVLDRNSQLDLSTAEINTGGVYAPQISYNPKNKTYYMTTMNMSKFEVFYVKSTNPEKGWSEPIHMKYGGMDTSFFFDKDGKAYVVYNAQPFAGAKYPGQTAIHMNEFDWRGDSIKGKTWELTTGSSCMENPMCIEGPHLYRVGKYYYLMAAEGGTENGHSEVIFRSKSLTGQWEEYPSNPILTQRNLKEELRQDKVTCTGHADLVQAQDGKWWAVFLGCRPYRGDDSDPAPYYADLFNTGRETFLLPVTWKDGWPVILEPGKAVPTVVDKANLQTTEAERPTGNYSFRDNFTTTALNPQWMYLRNPVASNYQLGNGLTLKPSEATLSEIKQPTALLFRQKNTSFTVETAMSYTPENTSIAGLALMQNEKNHVIFGKTLINGEPRLVLSLTAKGTTVTAASVKDNATTVTLKVEGNGRFYTFLYKRTDGNWQTLVSGVDCAFLSTPCAGGFAGVTVGPYTSLHQ